jgi:HEAT repeat protein
MNARTRYAEALPLVVEALSNDDVHIRREAAVFLAEVARVTPNLMNSKTSRALLPLMKDPDPVVRKNIVLALRNMTDDDVVRSGLQAMAVNEKNKRIQALAAEALERTLGSGTDER